MGTRRQRWGRLGRMLKSDNLGNLLGCAESGALGREGRVGSEEYFLRLPLTGGWDHLGPGGGGGEEGAQKGEGGKGTLGGRGGWRELEETLGKSIEGNIGKKKLQKLQDKAEKKKQREAEQQEREENKKKREALDEKERLEREKEKEEERLKEEEENRKREEKERKEHEEYLKLKEAFSVEDEGCDAAEDEDEENMLLRFINYIKETKVVKLEDLAAHFKLKTQEAIDRVTTLLADGLLTGVIDDRGKFIYISREELEAVAKYIKQQGRVSITDLAASSNKLIKL